MGIISVTQLGLVHDAAYTAGDDLFPSDIEPPEDPARITLTVAFDTPGILTLKRIGPSSTTEEQLFGGAELESNKLYTFTFDLARGQDFNLEYGFDAQVLILLATKET